MTAPVYKQYVGAELEALKVQHRQRCERYKAFVGANLADAKMVNEAEVIGEAISRLGDDDWKADPKVHVE